ncbi:7128_t:CDS:2 [Rhizophagus irregularis]|nr:7128_t:CDS:2 [Rhizophagus irregularis]
MNQIPMLRNKHQKANIATLPFRIRNNFRRLVPNRFSQPQDVILSDNDSIEIML